MKICQIILAGGSGTRLWPLSREFFPKQLLALSDENSLLQNTATRLDGVNAQNLQDAELSRPIVVCNEEHRFLVAEHLREADKPADTVMLEPTGRNTAPALTIAALAAMRHGDDPVLVVMPSDHVISDLAALNTALVAAIKLADQGRLVTFGIKPDQPETGYGYIQTGEKIPNEGDGTQIHSIGAFVEKPDQATAQAYLDAGDFLWNSGMFIMKASGWLAQIEQHSPDISASCRAAFDEGKEDGDFYRVDTDNFTSCPSDSIDYAVMEKIEQTAGAVVTLDAGWSDIGAWPALMSIKERDANGNVTEGDILTTDTSNSLLISNHRLVAAVGLQDIVVVETADAVMVAHKDRAQDVKKIVEQLREAGREESQFHRCVYRPWGHYESVDSGENFQVKRLTVNPGGILSLQKHHHRAEHWVVVSGTASVTRGEEEFLLSVNESTYIPVGTKHRLANKGDKPLEIIEVQSGDYLGEDDIVRYEDVYNRAD